MPSKNGVDPKRLQIFHQLQALSVLFLKVTWTARERKDCREKGRKVKKMTRKKSSQRRYGKLFMSMAER